ncbi:rRNA processing protein [Trapelia coarctata]|nr:rRNA processing protein [Trapelia coarctata]
MGSSVKKKKDKQKDFQKPKLRVGKTKPQAANFTDTSFKSKAILLNQQSLTTSAPSSLTQFTHHVSLLSSKSDGQRRDSLSYLTSAIASRRIESPLEQPVSVLLPKLLPLFLDGSNGVRNQLLKLLRVLPPADIAAHGEKLLIYIRAGMTHLAADIRISAMDILAWALDVAGEALVSGAGGWVKTLKCFLTMLGWSNGDTNASWSTSSASFSKAGSGGKTLTRNLNVLGLFLRTGLAKHDENESPECPNFPLSHVPYHSLPKRSNCFAHLNLFGPTRDEESEMYEDREERQKIFSGRFRQAYQRGLESAKHEGGEVGRAAASLTRFLSETVDSHNLEDV